MRIVTRAVRALVPVLISLALLLGLSRLVDYGSVADRLRIIPPWCVLAAMAAVLVNIVVGTWRYAYVIRDIVSAPPPFDRTLQINLLSLFLTYLLPVAALADAARIAAASRMLGLRPQTSARCVVHDRMLALAGLVLCAGLALPVMGVLQPSSPVVASTIAFVACALLSGAAVGLMATKAAQSTHAVLGFAGRAVLDFGGHLQGAPRLGRQVGFAVAGTLAFALQLRILALAVDIDLPFVAALAFSPLISLAQVVPFLYGGYGAREAVVAALLGGTWASPDAAVALGFSIGITNMLTSLPGALVAAGVTRDLMGRRSTGGGEGTRSAPMARAGEGEQ